jgi:hypothetical protein
MISFLIRWKHVHLISEKKQESVNKEQNLDHEMNRDGVQLENFLEKGVHSDD